MTILTCKKLLKRKYKLILMKKNCYTYLFSVLYLKKILYKTSFSYVVLKT